MAPEEYSAGPSSLPIDSWQEAERRAASWMRFWGWADARVTGGGGPDGGFDVVATGAVAQVKFWMNPVPRQDVQKLVGAASTLSGRRTILFFAKSGYTAGAQEWASSAGVATFNFDDEGVPQPQNRAAKDVSRSASGDEHVELPESVETE